VLPPPPAGRFWCIWSDGSSAVGCCERSDEEDSSAAACSTRLLPYGNSMMGGLTNHDLSCGLQHVCRDMPCLQVLACCFVYRPNGSF